ncbi:MAG: ankyrin repeat domain-containing protein [Candidatus Cloacimonetes bacterium]|nr:ankyrin repeat domain-containing protein [Candidatus Cloacimonadota bacterium]
MYKKANYSIFSDSFQEILHKILFYKFILIFLVIVQSNLLYAQNENISFTVILQEFVQKYGENKDEFEKQYCTNKNDLNIVDKDGNTLLISASTLGYSEFVKTLLELGADPNIRGNIGFTALHATFYFPVTSGNEVNINTVNYLLEYGADVNILDDLWKKPPMWLAIKCCDYKSVNALLKKGAKVEINQNFSALHIAAKKGCDKIANLLIMNGAKINYQDNLGHTPLLLAIESGNNKVVDILLDNNANLELITADGFNALDGAIALSNFEIAKKIIEKGANVNARINGWTALDYARFIGNENIIKHLHKYGGTGAKPNTQITDGSSIIDISVKKIDQNEINELLTNIGGGKIMFTVSYGILVVGTSDCSLFNGKIIGSDEIPSFIYNKDGAEWTLFLIKYELSNPNIYIKINSGNKSSLFGFPLVPININELQE